MSTKNLTINETPAMPHHSWRFGHLSAAELLPLLQQHLLTENNEVNWQLAWLNNDGKPIIALLPKVSWQVYFEPNSPSTYKVIQSYRDNHQATSIKNMTYDAWQQQLIAYSKDYENHDLSKLTKTTLNQPHYHHGLIGFIGYDIAARQLSPDVAIAAAEQPLAVLGHYDIYLTAVDSDAINNNADNPDAETNESAWLLNIRSTDNPNQALEDNHLVQLLSYLNALDLKLSKNYKTNALYKSKTPHETKKSLAPLMLEAQWQKSDYQRAFAQTQRYLQQGDCYQINLTQVWQGRLTALANSENNSPTTLNLIDYLPTLQHNTQAPFAGYISANQLNNNPNKLGFELLSCSPELFFTFSKDFENNKHYITTKPIKGTMPRGLTPKKDKALKQQLIDSDKDRSENVMIVDLLRNDLGKYAQTGSVKVPQLFAIESFSNVHHMVSTITAELKTATHPLSVLFGSLPAGSITGTPKKRAVEIISELEIGARGAYCGTMGYMNFDGSGQCNVLIRTIQANSLVEGGKSVSLWAGGGITVASECAAEYQECLDKVGNLLAVLAQAES